MSDSLQPHGLQHARLLCPSLSPRVCSDSCFLSWCCYPTVSLCRPFSFCLHLSQQQGLSSELPLHTRWPKQWSFSFSISPSSEYSGLISYRMDWVDLLAVQGTLKSLLNKYLISRSANTQRLSQNNCSDNCDFINW